MKQFKRASLMFALVGLAIGVGCSKDGDPQKGEGGAKAGPASTAPAAPALKPIEAPAELLLYGGTNGAKATLEALHAVASKVTSDVPPLAGMAAPAIQNMFRFKDAAAIDVSKSVRFAIFDRKTYGRAPEALMFGVTDPARLAEAFPEHEKTKDAAGNAWSYLKFPGSKQPVYVNFTGTGHAVVTRSETLFPKNKAFFEALGGATMPDQGAVYVELENVMRVHGGLFDAGVKQFKEMMQMAAAASPQAKGQMDAVDGMINWVAKAAREAKQLEARVIVADGVALDLRLMPKAGSPLSKQLGQLSGTAKADLLGKLPADAPFFFLAAMDPDKTAKMAATLSQAFMTQPIFKADPSKAAPYEKAVVDYMKAMDGQVAMAAHPSAQGLKFLGLFGVRDAKAMRAAQSTLLGLYSDPAAKAYYDTLGVSLDLQKAAYSVGDVPVDIQRTTMKNMPPEAMAMMGPMSDLFVQHIAIGDALGVMAYGESGRATVEALLGGKAAGGLDSAPGPKRAVSGAAKGFFLLTYINPIELAKAIKLGGMNPLAAMLADVKADSGVGFSAASSAAALHVRLDVPLATLKQGMAAFEKTKGSF